MSHRLTFLALVLCARLAFAAPDTLRFCREDQSDYPWTSGYIPSQLSHIESHLHVKIVMEERPWKRCLFELEHNLIDGVVSASYLPERAQIGVFPMRDKAPDESKRLLTSSYSFYRKVGSTVQWDGKQVTPANSLIGAQTSFSIGVRLRQMGFSVDDSSKGAEAIFERLIRGDLALAAIHTEHGDHILATQLVFHANVERLPVPIVEKSYFLVFSRRFYLNNTPMANQIWQLIEQKREATLKNGRIGSNTTSAP